jgi:CheY-like chemotaxis protein
MARVLVVDDDDDARDSVADGREVLRRLQGQSRLASMPVCVLSGELADGSDLPPGAALAIPKPLLVHRLVQIVTWLRECTRQ